MLASNLFTCTLGHWVRTHILRLGPQKTSVSTLMSVFSMPNPMVSQGTAFILQPSDSNAIGISRSTTIAFHICLSSKAVCCDLHLIGEKFGGNLLATNASKLLGLT